MNLFETSGHQNGGLWGEFDPERLGKVSEHPIVQCAADLILRGEHAVPIVESLEPTLIRIRRHHDLEDYELAIGFSIAAIQSAQEHARGRQSLDTPKQWME